jgi:tRNA-Thr(GGU) m(6)t(6)A37 methyltransferase TsaA
MADPIDPVTALPGLQPVGWVRSELRDVRAAPRQGDEGAPAAWLLLEPRFLDAAADLQVGDDLVVLTWLHRADRGTLRVHPRDDTSRPQRGVFSTRSQDRPNPIGLHRVRVLEVAPGRIRVSDLEAVDGTPVVDIKIAL